MLLVAGAKQHQQAYYTTLYCTVAGCETRTSARARLLARSLTRSQRAVNPQSARSSQPSKRPADQINLVACLFYRQKLLPEEVTTSLEQLAAV